MGGSSSSATTKEAYYANKEMMISHAAPLVDMSKMTQAAKGTCQIIVDNKNATGFFVQLPLGRTGRTLRGLMTNNHVLGERELRDGFTFFIKPDLNDNHMDRIYRINITNGMFRFTDAVIDVSFIEIKPTTIPGFNDIRYLDVDPNIDENSWITILQHPNGDPNLKQAIGVYVGGWGFEILHEVNTNPGSSGSALLTIESKVFGIHKASNPSKHCNVATRIDVAMFGIARLYLMNYRTFSRAVAAARRLSSYEIEELRAHGLRETNNPLIFISPSSLFVTQLWFYRSNHAWYWTPKEPRSYYIGDLIDCNWSIIGEDFPIKAIGGYWNGQSPAWRNVELIEWLISTGLRFLQ